MRVIIGNQYYPTIEGSSVSITGSAGDPVSTCTLNLRDINSTLKPLPMQEILVLDDQAIPYPALNMAPNPTLNPYTNTAAWDEITVTGVTLSQITGGGVKITCSNVALNGAFQQLLYTYMPGGGIVHGAVPGWGQIIPGQTYTASAYVQGSGSPSGFGVFVHIDWFDASLNFISGAYSSSPIPPSGTNTRYIVSSVAPANAATGYMSIGITGPNSTNSGSALVTNLQFEPNWIPTLSYPTPFCGPSQTNCQQLPTGQWIRQARNFAGFVNHVTAQDYHGNVRTLVVDSVSYAWLMGTIFANDTFTSQADSAIISSLLTKYLTDTYLTAGGSGLLTTTNVVTGVTVSSLQANWDDLRTLFDGLCGLSGYYWTVDQYWNFIYAPPGYFSMGIGLICDDSANPDFVTTYPAYNFSAESDFTQPGSSILVIGNGTNVAQVIDPAQTGMIGFISGYLLPTGTSWMRKVNDSTLASVTDCVTRGSAELLQYDDARNLYHLTTNVALIPGHGVPITSATEGLSASVQLIQQVTATWIGTDETLTDVWEYASDLGSANRTATNMMSRIFRITQSGSSAPAISNTTLETFENIGIEDAVALTTTLAYGYQPTIQADRPIAYYRLNAGQGTVVDDFSGHANVGTTHGSPTLGVATLLTDSTDSSDTAMTFASASSQFISLPTGLIPTGTHHAWSLECWCKVSSFGSSGIYGAMVAMGTNSTGQAAQIKTYNNAGTPELMLSTYAQDIFSGAVATNTVYHVVGTYDGTSTRLYVNGTLAAGPTAYSVTLGTSYASIGADNGANDLYNGTLDESAIYNYALSTTQIATHYAAGTSVYALAVMQDAPSAYYRLGEASGTTANDASGNGHNGTLNGGITLGTTGLIFNDSNTAMTFNGSTGYVSLPTTGLSTGASAWSLEAWCKLASIPSAGTYCMASWGTASSLQMAAISLFSNGTTAQFLCDLGGGNHAAGPFTVATSTTYHVVATYDGANLRLYVDGSLLAGPTGFTPNIVLAYATIGSESNSFDFFPGVIDEVAIYSTALSVARIQTHYNVGTLGHI